MSKPKAIRAKKLYDGSMGRPIENAVVIFDGTGILDVLRPGEEAKAQRYGAEIEDAGLYMTPGLIDAHVHVDSPGTGFIEGELFDTIPPGEVQIMAYQNAMASLRAGITTLCDCGTKLDIAIHTRNYIERCQQGPDILVCGGAISTTAGHGYFPENAADGADEIRLRIRQLQGKGVDFIKLLPTTEVSHPDLRMIGFAKDELKAGIDEAHRLGYKVTNHATFTGIIRLLTELGADGIEHCMFATSNWGELDLDKGLCELMLKKGVMPDHTLAVSVAYLEHLQQKEKAGTLTAEEKLELPRQIARKEQLLEQFSFQIGQGLPSMAGSDAGFEFSSHKTGLALSLELMAEGGMSNLAVIHSCTGLTARHYGWDDRIGTVLPGMQADLALWEKDPGEDISAFRNVSRVYKRGQLVL